MDLVAWALVLVVRALWGRGLRWESRRGGHLSAGLGSAAGGPVLVCQLRASSFPARSFYRDWGATTFGHGIMYGAGVVVTPDTGGWSGLQEHEHVHVKQMEGAMLIALVVGLVTALLTGWWLLGLGIWATGWVQTLAAGWTAAWLRGESVYAESAHEQAAYAVEQLYDATVSQGDAR
jgi:hypothetical protein